MNRTLLDKGRTILIDSGLPKYLWGEAIRCAAYQLNRCPTVSLKGDVPARKWYGSLDLNKLRVFGCKVWVYNLPKLSKFDDRASEARMVGYSNNGYRLWLPEERKIICARDVKFDETSASYSPKNLSNNGKNILIETYEDMKENDEQEEENIENEEPAIKGRPRRNTKIPEKLNDYELYTAYCLMANNDPGTYEEAVNQGKEWQEAIKKEFDAHEKLGTWEEAKLPKGKKAIDTRWIFRTKEGGLKKARLVARGYQEICEENVYSPVARLSTLRMLLSLAVQKNWTIQHFDVPTAFLNGYLSSDIYIKAPKGLPDRKKIYKLRRSLYGLKEAPRCWNERLNDYIVQYNFRRSKSDFCLYIGEEALLLVYVDDILVTGEDTELIIQKLKEEFKIKEVGELANFIGIQIEKHKNSIQISQKNMIGKILDKFNMSDCKGSKTPMEGNLQIEPTEEVVNVPYRELIGSLMYLSVASRPDITFAVSYLSQFLDKPSEQAWKAAKRILRYLKHTENFALVYNQKNNNEGNVLESFADADWAGNKVDRKSVSGCIVYYHENLVSWFSRKQNSVSLSSTEAEYIAAAAAATELISLVGVAEDLEGIKQKNVLLRIDNQGAIDLTKGYENSKRSKHIDIRHHFIKDLVQKGQINIEYIPTNDNQADLLTKSLGVQKFEYFRNLFSLN